MFYLSIESRKKYAKSPNFSYVAMPQGFDMGSAFTEKVQFPIFTKNTEVRENYDQERSIHGIEGPIQGTSMFY